MDCILNRRFLNKFIFIILAVIADNNRVDLLLDGSPKLSLSFIENHIVKITEDGFLNVTLPTFEEKIDYDVGETASWTVLIDYTEYNKPVNLQWYKNGRPIQNYNVKDTNSEKRYEIVDIADYHTSLTVRNVSKMDEGDFQLFINIADGNHQSFMINFTLRVRDEPSYFIIKTTPSDDDKSGLICWIYSRPPIIGFTFPGRDQSLLSPKMWREIFNLDQESYTKALLSEENVITIFVQPQTGNISKNLEFQTMRGPRRISSRRNIDQIQLSCTTSNITSNINRIPYSSDNLIWYLKLPNNDTSIKLDEFSNYQGLRILSLPCIFFGLHHQPCPFIKMLVWRNVIKATEGIYSVSVFNENTETKPQTLAFKIKASTRPSIWNSSDSNNSAKEGEDASIFCQATGSPLTFMTIWTKDGSLITNTSNTLIKSEKTEMMVTSVLVISSARTTDSGRYTCSFDNTAGEIEKIINLQIMPIKRNITNDTEVNAKK